VKNENKKFAMVEKKEMEFCFRVLNNFFHAYKYRALSTIEH
jgi:hypothetical protein